MGDTSKVAPSHEDGTDGINEKVTEIAEQLNFPNPSFFCTYFKRIECYTPQEYRQGLR